MFLLVLGVLIWALAHLSKRLIPGFHKALKGVEKPMMGGIITIGVVLMVIGYRSSYGDVFWGASPQLMRINNLLMLIAVYLFAAAGMKTALARRFRHPMLIGVVVWALAHLLVNGDVESFVLFGGLGIWALVEIAVINAKAPHWVAAKGKGAKMEVIAVLGTVVVYGAIAGVHYMFGYPVFG